MKNSIKNLFHALKDVVLDYVKHRLFVFTLIALFLFGLLIYRLFVLQIVEGEEHLANFAYKSERTLSLESSRGNIYDKSGRLLAYNKLAYSITFENDIGLSDKARKEGVTVNFLKNEIINNIIKIIEENDGTMVNDFPIILNDSGEFEFNLTTESRRLRFIADVYGVTKVDKLTDEQKNATAEDIFLYFKNGTGARTKNFDISDVYTDEEALKIMSVRYSVWLNRYQQYVPITIARDVSDETVAIIKENSDTLLGVDVAVESVRVYNDSKYFAHIIGYIGNVSTDEMSEYNENLSEKEQYTSNDMIGKSGLEKEMEEYLRGSKGYEKIFVDNLGRVLEVEERRESSAGEDIYLTIDSDLQKYCYNALEKEIAGIILANMVSGAKDEDSKNVQIPITEIYFALFNNNVISLSQMQDSDASAIEQGIYQIFLTNKANDITKLDTLLKSDQTIINNLSDENADYTDYIYKMLVSNGVLNTDYLDSSDDVYQKYVSGDTYLTDFLKYAINKGAIDISGFNADVDYYDSDEVFTLLVDYIKQESENDVNFDKLVMKYMINYGNVRGYDICMVLYDQGVLSTDDEDYPLLTSSAIGPYEFMRRKIQNLEITPAQLAIDPCEGSVVVTDVNTGEVLALASYPSYDNNKLTNSIDAEYYNKLLNDNTKPLYNRATQQKTAPGSTYKMLTTIAGVSENAINLGTTITDESEFKLVTPSPKCWIYPGSHGTIGIEQAIEVSCNYFYYVVGYNLGTDDNNNFSDKTGLDKLAKYAGMFGLDRNSGIEISEAQPNVSDESAVRSAIGQGTNSYTATQLSRYVSTLANSGNCYDLSIIKERKTTDGDVTFTNPHNISGVVSIPNELWNTVHNGMRRVVTNHTSSTALINRINVAVAGKTGTAQEDKTRPPHALFVSYAPFDSPEISVTCVIPYGYSSGNAEELAGFIYAYYYDKDLLENESVQGNNNTSD